MNINKLIGIGITASVALAACSTPTEETSGVRVVVSTSVLGQPISEILDCAGLPEAEVLIPAGSSAHGYVPSSQQVASMISADLVVLNGLGLEGGFADAIENATADGAVIFEVGEFVNPLASDEHAQDEHAEDDHAEEEHTEEEHAHGEFDPHFWLDMQRVATGLEAVGDKLVEITSDETFATCAAQIADEIRTAETQMIQTLSTIPQENRKLVTDHEAFNYFAAAYDFEVIGAVVPSVDDLANPSSADLTELANAIKSNSVEAIFVSPNSSKAGLAEAVATEVGYEVGIYNLLIESVDAGSTYIQMMQANAETLVEALQ